jgi:hypothetical protein
MDDTYDDELFLHYNVETDEGKYAFVQLFINLYFNDAKNTIDYSYEFHFKSYFYTRERFVIYRSIPQVIRLGKSNQHERDIAKMMYSPKEYLHYLVKNKIDLERIKKNIATVIEDNGKYATTQDDFDKHLGVNPLGLKIDTTKFFEHYEQEEPTSEQEENIYKLVLDKDYKHEVIRIMLVITFSEDRQTINYKYNVYNSGIDKHHKPKVYDILDVYDQADNFNVYRHYDEIHTIHLSPIETWKDDLEVMKKLIKSYHIVDNVIKEEMKLIDDKEKQNENNKCNKNGGSTNK